MTSVIPGTAVGSASIRARRNVRLKNTELPAVMTKKESPSTGIFQHYLEVVAFIEKCRELFPLKEFKCKEMQSAIPVLNANLKIYGHQLESTCKDQLDRLFVEVRNLSKDEKLDKISRLHLLELVELRASRWVLMDETNSYYKFKLAELNETSDVTQFALPSPALQQQQPSYGSLYSDQTEFSISPPPMLLPGETVKFSGKYSGGQPMAQGSQQRAQPAGSGNKSSTSIKDEVVIRNSDSGKVMGIKGRRVHLIEEISDTVISFQRVNAGAKERLVQITGPGQENIEQARQLIEQTIQRNASPVRSADCDPGVDIPHLMGHKEEDPPAYTMHHLQQSGRQSVNAMDLILGEYQYTVTVGEESIKITGKSLALVQAAKLALDDNFAALAGDRKRTTSRSSSIDDGVGSLPSSQQESPRECCSGPAKNKTLRYTRDRLLQWSHSPLCVQPPANFHLLHQHAPEIMRKVKV